MKLCPGNLSFRSFLAVSRLNFLCYFIFFRVRKFFGSVLEPLNRFYLYA